MADSKKILIIFFLLFSGGFLNSQLALACAVCDSQLSQAVRSEITHTSFWLFSFSIFVLFLIFFCLALLIPHFKRKFLNNHPLAAAGILIGGGVAGFLDAILFHQLLQTHALVSNYLPITAIVNVKVNMFWDGVFEFFTLVILLIGLLFLWRVRGGQKNLSGKVFTGWLFVGFGLFNFLEGALDHELLRLHQVLQPSAGQWAFYADILFLLVALIFMLVGVVLIRRDH
jgi:uncharacterized membrane protein